MFFFLKGKSCFIVYQVNLDHPVFHILTNYCICQFDRHIND